MTEPGARTEASTPAERLRTLLEEGLASGDPQALDEEMVAALRRDVFGPTD